MFLFVEHTMLVIVLFVWAVCAASAHNLLELKVRSVQAVASPDDPRRITLQIVSDAPDVPLAEVQAKLQSLLNQTLALSAAKSESHEAPKKGIEETNRREKTAVPKEKKSHVSHRTALSSHSVNTHSNKSQSAAARKSESSSLRIAENSATSRFAFL